MSDPKSAFISISTSNSSDEAHDAVHILARMYCRFFESMNWNWETIFIEYGPTAGISNVDFSVYGLRPEDVENLVALENGFHSVIYRSPFDAGNRRTTTFTRVNICEALEHEEFPLLDSDLEVTTFRKSSGASGGNVNQPDSAVRIRHIPTEIVTSSNQKRSLIYNKVLARSLLRAKLHRHGHPAACIMRTYNLETDAVWNNGQKHEGICKKVIDGWLTPFWPPSQDISDESDKENSVVR